MSVNWFRVSNLGGERYERRFIYIIIHSMRANARNETSVGQHAGMGAATDPRAVVDHTSGGKVIGVDGLRVPLSTSTNTGPFEDNR